LIDNSTNQIVTLLRGATFNGFRIDGGVWSLQFDKTATADRFYLLGQELLAQSPDKVMRVLEQQRSAFPSATDFEDATLAFLLSMARGRSVVDLTVNENADLPLEFPDGVVVRVSGEIPVVDWMWCISEFDNDPYRSSALFACIAPGQIEVPVKGFRAPDRLQ